MRFAKSISSVVFPYPAGADTRINLRSTISARRLSNRSLESRSLRGLGMMILVRVIGTDTALLPGVTQPSQQAVTAVL